MDLGTIKYSVEADTDDLSRASAEMESTREAATGAKTAADDLGKSSDAAARKTKTATEQMRAGYNGVASAVKVASAAMAAIGITTGISNSIRQIADFQAAMNGLRAVSGATETQMVSLEKQARSLGATSQYSAQQAAEAQRFLAQAGFEVNEVLGATPGILSLATAGSLSLAEAADIASNVLGGMRLEVAELSRVNDVLAATAQRSNTNIRQLGDALSYAAPFAASAGVSIEETSAAIGVMSDAGIQASRAGTGLVGVIRQLSTITPRGAEVLDQLGLSASDVNIEANGLQSVLDLLATKSLNVEQAIKLFGSEAGAAAQILVASSDRFGKFATDLGDVEGVAQRAALVIGQGLGPSMRGLASAISESVLQLGDSGLAGGLESVIVSAAGVISVYNGMGQLFAEANGLTEEQYTNMNNLAASLKGVATAVAAMTTAVYGYSTAAALATGATNTLLGAVSKLFLLLRANPIGATVTAVVGLGAALYGARDALVTFGDTQARIQDWGRAAWTVTSEHVVNVWGSALASVQDKFETFTDWLGRGITWMNDTFGSFFTNVIAWGKNLGNNLIATFTTLVDATTILVRTMLEQFSGGFEKILNVGRGFAESLKATLAGDFSFGSFKSALDSNFVDPWLGAFEEIRAASQANQQDYIGGTIDIAAEAIRGFKDEVSDLAFMYRYMGNETEEAAKGFEKLGLSGSSAAEDTQNLIDQLDGVAASSKETKTATDELARAYQMLRDRLRPVEAANRRYNEEKATLLAYALRENQSVEELQGLLRDLEADYRNSGDAAEVYGFKGTKAAEDIKSAVDLLVENSIKRLDDTLQDLWAGAIDGSRNAWDTIKRGFTQMLAEMAHAAITKPIVVGFQSDLGQMMSGNGFSLAGTGGAIKDVFSAGKSAMGLFGGGSAAATGGLYANAATAGVGTLYGSAATGAAIGGTGAAAGGAAGLLGSAGAAIGTAMPWIGAGLAIDSLLGGKISGAIGGLFGGRSKSPRLNVSTYGERSAFSHDSVATSALGTIGFGKGTRRSDEAFGGIEEERQWLAGYAALDNILASLAETPAQLEEMQRAAQGFRVSVGTAAEASARMNDRTVVIAATIDGYFAASLRKAGLNAEQMTTRIAGAAQAMQLVDSASERLNLQYDKNGHVAMYFADVMAQQAGGVENLANMQSAYYQQYFSEAERAVHLQEDITRAINAMGLAMPESEAGFRALVEAQNQHTEAGARNYVQLLSLSGAFSELQQVMGRTNEVTRSAADIQREREQLETRYLNMLGTRDAELELRARELNALDESNKWRLEYIHNLEDETKAQEERDRRAAESLQVQEQLETRYLNMLGTREAELELRARELNGMDAGNQARLRAIHTLEDEQTAQKNAERAQQERIKQIEREAQALQNARDQLASFSNSIGGWLAQFDASAATGGTPRDRLEASDADFWAQYEKALGGDRTAQQDITQYADRYIANLQEMYASGPSAQSGIAEIRDAMARLPEMLSPEQFLAEEFASIIGGQTDALTSALDLNGDGTVSAIERAITEEWDSSDALQAVLSREMTQLGTTVLTEAQVRAALRPHATDAEIDRLIKRVDTNGNGLISRQELTNARIGSLSTGVANSLSGHFDMLDANLDGKLTFDELKRGLVGIATDEELKRIVAAVDLNGDGIISQLEAQIVAAWDQSDLTNSVLHQEMQRLGTTVLTEAQVRAALKPHATDAEIDRLIKRIDLNGDGVISQQELTNARIGGLSVGIAGSLSSHFEMLDSNLDGKLTFDELKLGLRGIATDSELRRILEAVDLNGDNAISAVEAQIAAGSSHADLLQNVLNSEMRRLGATVLTESQVRAALKPHATDEEIKRLIRHVDANGDGLITQQELTNARIGGLTNGFANAIAKEFDKIDINADGLIDYGEFRKAFSGMATDSELRRIFNKLDRDGSGTIRRLDAINSTTGRVSNNTGSIDSRARNSHTGMRVTLTHGQPGEVLRQIGWTFGQQMNIWSNDIGKKHAQQMRYQGIGNGGRAYAKGGVFTNSIVDSPTYFNESVMGEAGPEAIVPLHMGPGGLGIRNYGGGQTPSFSPIPQFPLLGNGDIIEALRDLKNEVAEFRKEDSELQREGIKHKAAAVRVAAEGYKQQIEATERGNRSLRDMAAGSRLERSK